MSITSFTRYCFCAHHKYWVRIQLSVHHLIQRMSINSALVGWSNPCNLTSLVQVKITLWWLMHCFLCCTCRLSQPDNSQSLFWIKLSADSLELSGFLFLFFFKGVELYILLLHLSYPAWVESNAVNYSIYVWLIYFFS